MLDLSKVCIKSTTEYNKFGRASGNREVSPDNVKRLVASMGENHLASIGIVNSKNEIIDGQHRIKACEALGIPFNYIVMEDYGIEEVHILNANSKNWTNEDYVKQFAERYREGEHIFIDYEEITIFMEEHSLSLNESLLLFEGGVKSGTITLRSGIYKRTEELERIEENLENIIELQKVLGLSVVNQAFWQVFIMSSNLEGFNPQRFINKSRRAKELLFDNNGSFKSLNTAFEEVYNFKQSIATSFEFAHINARTNKVKKAEISKRGRNKGGKNDD